MTGSGGKRTVFRFESGVLRPPLRAVHRPANPSVSERLQPGCRRDRLQQPEQRDHRCSRLLAEALQQRRRQRLDLDWRRQPAPQRRPEPARRERLPPPPPPPLQRPRAHPEQPLQLRCPLRCRPVAQRAHQHHHRAEVHPPPQEAHRRRRRPPPTPLAPAAEAQPQLEALRRRPRPAPRLPLVVRHVQPPIPAHLATSRLPRRRKIDVNLQEQHVESGVPQRQMAQRVTSESRSTTREPSRRTSSKFSEGVFLWNLNERARRKLGGHRAGWRCSLRTRRLRPQYQVDIACARLRCRLRRYLRSHQRQPHRKQRRGSAGRRCFPLPRRCRSR